MALAKGARNGGVRIFEGTKVTAIKKRSNRVAGVVTDKGEIEAEYVVNCAGMWAGEVGKLASVDIPLQAAEHYYLITEPIEGVTADYNMGDGISVQGFSALTIKHVIASHNEDIYGDVWAGYGISARSNLAAFVNLENIQASYNASNGIYIYTLGAVRAKYIEAN